MPDELRPGLGGSGQTAWNENIDGGHFYLQEEWSNADSACEPRAKPDSVSFAPPRTAGRARSVSFTGRGIGPARADRLVRVVLRRRPGAPRGRSVSHTFKRARELPGDAPRHRQLGQLGVRRPDDPGRSALDGAQAGTLIWTGVRRGPAATNRGCATSR